MSTEYLIRLPWPAKALWPNGRAHHMAKARAFKAAKQYAWAAMKEAGTGQATSATLRFSFHPKPKGRKPDMDNCIASVKAYIDGIALALGCDDGKFKLHFPAELSDPRIDGRVSVEIDLG